MAEPFSIGAGVVGVCNLAIEVVKLANGYVGSARSASCEIKDLVIQTKALKEVLERLQAVLRDENGEEGAPFKPDSALSLALEECKKLLSHLQKKLEKLQSSGTKYQTLVWPFKKQECADITRHLFQHTHTFQFFLTLSNRREMAKSCEDLRKSLKEKLDHLKAVENMMSTVPDEISRLSAQVESTLSTITRSADEFRGLSTQIQTIEDSVRDNEKDALLRFIPSLEPSKQHQDILFTRLEGTSGWILQDPTFKGWRYSAQASRTLYCLGDPGAGKTVTTSLVIHELSLGARKASGDQRIGVAYLYCDYRYQTQQSTVNLVGTILGALLASLTHIPEEVISIYKRCRGEQKTFGLEETKEALSFIWGRFDEIYICVDALDELQDMVPFLQWLSTVPQMVKILLTSRYHVQNKVECLIGVVSRIRIEAQESDIKTLIKGRIDESKLTDGEIMNDALEEAIIDKITRMSGGTFLLPALHIRTVLEARTRSKRRSALGSLSTELDETFGNTISRIKEQSKSSVDQAMRILKWVLLAEGPLSVDELMHALATEIGDQDLDRENIPDRRSLLDCCLGLVIIPKEASTVRLVHFALQEYLMRIQEKLFPSGHDDIAQTCLTYLLFESLPDTRYEADPWLRPLDYESPSVKFPLLYYAAYECGNHVRKACPPKDNTVHLTRQYFAQDQRTFEWTAMFAYYNSPHISYPGPFIPLHVASIFGIPQILDWDTTKSSLNETDSTGKTPLSLAVNHGHREAVDFLVQKGAAIEPAGPKRDQREELWSMLRYRIREFDPPLLDAARTGYKEILTFLIDKGANVHITDWPGRTALSYAAKYGHLQIVQFLIDRGVSIDQIDAWGLTALTCAAESGHTDVVKLLVENGADVNGRCQPNPRPLEEDTENTWWQGAVPTNLSASESKLPVVTRVGQTPISYAAMRGNDAMLGYLISKGADVTIADIYGATPLFYTLEAGKCTAARLLLANGADVNAKDFKGRSPLMRAAERGHKHIVQLLKDEGADIDYVRCVGWKVCGDPTAEEYEEITRLLGCAPRKIHLWNKRHDRAENTQSRENDFAKAVVEKAIAFG